ncbi:WD and tetratricopeptide repeats protein 1 isoform X1 [Hippocampus zosterae]|uniref:WD and tetratricopeptide repeats protein 1 isoform X1 n=1 Tax=Hippocampus zosterae TaxID=109293 RepID=UPI00223E474D|nr:WD and tetratricopeptide repeats protein 1 isoform X1 [Hippocampus zosterae]XP_051922654.1 WD and tetratricopeptide repeats protein 1 isoform X1 [Hippocampus zosterae]XP_051922655.1 WD and tetratricopeptide repeats protein 1 isoform X1 [Hippocampus zosterae]
MNNVNITRDILHRQIREKAVSGFQRFYHVTDPFIKRLGLEAELQGHTGCVNCLEWNEHGDLLASGSDDQHAIIWDPFRLKKLTTMHTGHAANIFSVKFLPHSGDRILVTGAADTKVHVHDLTAEETIHMFSDHTNRVKRIATAPMWPNTFWSAAEDGIIRQYDLRESSKRSEVLIDLTKFCGRFVEAKCLAVNPRDNNYLAVGANGPFVRLYDIRMIQNCRKSLNRWKQSAVRTFLENQKPIPEKAVQYYVAGHLPEKRMHYNNRLRVLVVTYVTFSPDGTELLVNMGGEQVYLFDLTCKQTPYTLLLPETCQPSTGDVQNGKTTNGVHSKIQLSCCSLSDLPPHLEKIKQQANDAFAQQHWTQAIQLYSIGINHSSCNAILYGNRAAAYMKRKWDGDHYDALKDCLKALTLNPDHLKAHFRLARCLFELKYVSKALECLNDFKEKFPEQAHSTACDALDKDIKAFSNTKSAEDDSNSFLRFHSISQLDPIPMDEFVFREQSLDYKHRYCGHCNTTTDIKEANFFGSKGQYIVSGSDDGSFFIWEKETTNLVRIMQGDESIVNCLQPHPTSCFLASSGIDPVVRLWNPRPETESENGRVVEDMEGAAQANQRRMNADPLEVMLLNMGYRTAGLRGVGPDGSDDEDSSDGQMQCRPS